MRHFPSDKYNVAWFKLAECVSRGEKEKALGVYRLLSHSLDDAAFASQLAGDILCSFDDSLGAIPHYREAAYLYQKDNRLLEAAAVYEHLLTLMADKYENLVMLVDLYRKLNLMPKVEKYLDMLFALSLGRNDLDAALNVIEQCDEVMTPEHTVTMRGHLVFALLKQDMIPQATIMKHIAKVVDTLMQSDDSKALQKFLSELQAVNEFYHTEACRYIEKDS